MVPKSQNSTRDKQKIQRVNEFLTRNYQISLFSQISLFFVIVNKNATMKHRPTCMRID